MSTSALDPQAPAGKRTGVWFVGARGSVATTATVGALAVSSGLASRTGLVSDLDEVAAARLTGVAQLVTGGHDVASEPISARARALAESGVFPPALLASLDEEIAAADSRVRLAPREGSQRSITEAVQADIEAFRHEHDLERVVVVDVSSTEPPAPPAPELENLAALERALDAGLSPLPARSVYSYAAFRAGCPVVAFTPSAGPNLGALIELAKQNGVPWAGRDGKTGETLVKTTLAPMFATRALRVRSWASYNMLGGGDGLTLADPQAAVSKTTTKGVGIDSILGHHVEGPLHIDYVEDFGDWKTAWDNISFEGFLGTRMSLQFTWQGCDSALAAPLVLDLVRLLARADEVGESGAQGALGFFFKDPLGALDHSLAAQWSALVQWCEQLGSRS